MIKCNISLIFSIKFTQSRKKTKKLDVLNVWRTFRNNNLMWMLTKRSQNMFFFKIYILYWKDSKCEMWFLSKHWVFVFADYSSGAGAAGLVWEFSQHFPGNSWRSGARGGAAEEEERYVFTWEQSSSLCPLSFIA